MTKVLGPGEGIATYSARGSEMTFKAIGTSSGGDISVMERTLPPGGRRPPAHRHTNCTEAYFVLDGEVTVSIEGLDSVLGPQHFVLVQRGEGHTFGNSGTEAARLLVLHAPAIDRYFAELHQLWSGAGPPSASAEQLLMERFGMELA
jgi:uncharacterized cupin superfamily protein